MKTNKAPNINYLWAKLIVEELIRNGVEYFCISPGSRSAALTMAVAQHPKAKHFIHYDERGSAFHALGYVAATKRPCAIITTSGTAAANLLPAIIETSKKKLPLVVLTADRPPELRNTGAHQTIDQVKLFGEYVRWFFDMPAPTTDIAPEFVLTTIDQAVFQAKGNPSGSVHINCMFREPLDPVKKGLLDSYTKHLNRWEKSSAPYTSYLTSQTKLGAQSVKEIAAKLKTIKSGVIVVGKINSEDADDVLRLSEKLNWPIFPDVTSTLRLGATHKNIIHHFDQILLSKQDQNKIKIDGVLHLGGRITSKRWYQFVEQTKPAQYIVVLGHPLRNDPLHNVSTRVQCAYGHFCKSVFPHVSKQTSNGVLNALQKLNIRMRESIENVCFKNAGLTEAAAARIITQCVPKTHALFSSSSLPIRQFDMYGDYTGANVRIGSNRGASGIDGTIATAVGFSKGLDKSVTLLIGDLAFLYDLNSLSMLREMSKSMVIVVLNNNGGGIFSFLPIAQNNKYFQKFFTTPQNVQFSAAADMFDLNYFNPKTCEEFADAYALALKRNTSTIIEVTSDVDINLKIQEELKRK